MSFKEIVNTIKISKEFMLNFVKQGQVVLDCTVGNGNDTLILAKCVGHTGKVYGFDIQKEAIERTKEKLDCENLGKHVILILDGHENIDIYIKEELDFVIYNLGYLPRGDKSIITKKETTLISLEKALGLLKENGVLLITCYIGHEGGLEEKNAVETFLTSLDQGKYNVLKHEFINQQNKPPILFIIEKSKTGGIK
ncbi:MAG: methyltransferase domain-containing protein [Tissierellia bacterium]|nr:methyltransferase domain-containing protein [Tissierellia bacterium]